MAITRTISDLPKAAQVTTSRPSLFRDVLEEYLLYKRDFDGDLPMAGPDARIRHSWAGNCARQIGYRLVCPDEAVPPDAEALWSFAMGHAAHDIIQNAFTHRYGDRAQIEFKVDLGERACTIDIVLRFDKPEIFMVDGTAWSCKVVVLELKSTGGYSWSLQVKKEGPKLGAYLQGSVNAAAVDADLLVIGYVTLDRQNKTASLFGVSREPLDAVWASWAYPRHLYLPDAQKEIERLGRVVAIVDEGGLPPRRTPDMPAGTKIVDPSSGRWEIHDRDGNLVEFGLYWGCMYCPFQARCVLDAAAGL